MGISGKTVIITGASSGIGEATARNLAAAGANVVLGARRGDRLTALVDDIVASGGKASAQVTDVTSCASVQELVDHAVQRFGHVDVLINNAGVMPLSRLEVRDVDGWDRTIDTNIKGMLYGIAAVLPIMQARRQGQIISIASVSAHVVKAGFAVYAGTKSAVRAISESMRQEVAADGIRVTLISPGITRSELLEKVDDPGGRQRIADLSLLALPADSVARAIAYAINEPDDVDVNEIVVRPQAQEL